MALLFILTLKIWRKRTDERNSEVQLIPAQQIGTGWK